MELRITSWNLQGRERPDLDGVVEVINRLGADLVLVQEVQRRQAEGLAARLDWHSSWHWKHWPIVFRPEGMAMLSPDPIDAFVKRQLAHRWRFWASKRRIALGGTYRGLRVVDVHLGHQVDNEEQVRQATLVLGMVDGDDAVAPATDASTPAVIGGDFNATPGAPAFELTEAAGFIDTWVAREGAHYPTFWGRRREGMPHRCIDYVLIRGGSVVQPPFAGFGDDSDWMSLRELSDHAPVTVTVAFDRSAASIQPA